MSLSPPLSPAQKTALKTFILADAQMGPLVAAQNESGAYDLWNVTANPAFTVWRSLVSLKELGDNIVATDIANMTAVNVSRLDSMFMICPSGVNASMADRRAAFADIFSGAAGAATLAKLTPLWKRLANRTEKFFATGTGSDASPATLVVEGMMTFNEFLDVVHG
jgi:hypothetical protein